jgi:hypothetical protein
MFLTDQIMMKPSINVITTKTLTMLSVLLVAVFAISCDDTKENSVWPGEFDTNPAPVLSTISPETEFLAGVGTLELTGQNFSSNPSENRVYFNDVKAVVLEASPTRLLLRTPNLVSEEVRIRVSVVGADLFSNTMMYRLLPTIQVPAGLRDSDSPYAVTTNAEGDIFLSNLASGVNEGIVVIANEEKTTFVPPRGWWYQNIKIGPDGRIYMVRGGTTFANVYVAPAAGGPEGFFVRFGGGLGDLDFDQNNYMWTGGANQGTANNKLYRVDLEGNVAEYIFDANIRAIRYYDGNLYVGGLQGTTKGVWRFPVDGNNDLGTPALVFELPGDYTTQNVRAITFDANGNMFVGITGSDPILEVSASGGWEVLYPGVLQGDAQAFGWLPGTTKLLVILETGERETTLYEVEMLREGAPYYGSTN